MDKRNKVLVGKCRKVAISITFKAKTFKIAYRVCWDWHGGLQTKLRPLFSTLIAKIHGMQLEQRNFGQ